MISMTVNGQSCNPANCLVVSPGAWTFSSSAFSTGQVVDMTFGLQSIQPAGTGGIVTAVVIADADAASIATSIGGVDRNGSTNCSATIANKQITETCVSTVGGSGTTGGDFQGVWIAVVPPIPPIPPKPPVTPQCPDLGVYPDCYTTPPPPQPPSCTTCVAPPDAPPVPLPAMGDAALCLMGAMVLVVAMRALR